MLPLAEDEGNVATAVGQGDTIIKVRRIKVRRIKVGSTRWEVRQLPESLSRGELVEELLRQRAVVR